MKPIIFRKIIWAVDVMDSPNMQDHALLALGALARPTGARIEPVFVMGEPYTQTDEEGDSLFEEAFKALAEKRIAQLAQKSDIETLGAGQILINRSSSAEKDVRTLVDFAVSSAADAILVSTHGRKGMARFFMGSFAETLALTSSVPVITVNPETKVRERIAKILVPTTFRPRYRETFERAVALAKTLDAEITLYYKEPPNAGFVQNPDFYRVIAEEAVARAKTAEEWLSWSVQQGVRTNIELDNSPGRIAVAIEEYAGKYNFDLIAMASQADRISAVLMGSLARQTIRHAPCPVWVMRTDQ